MQNHNITSPTSVSDVEQSADDLGHSKPTSLPRQNEATSSETEHPLGHIRGGVTDRYYGPKVVHGHSRDTVSTKYYGLANS
jgi:hypothetical protein